MLRLAHRSLADVSSYAVAETAIQLPADVPVDRVDHHRAHAATAFLTSSYDDAVVLVCDRHGEPELTVWRGEDGAVRQEQFCWSGPAFASLYGRACRAFGMSRERDEHRLEALARVADAPHPFPGTLLTYRGGAIDVPASCEAAIAEALERPTCDPAHAARVAAGVQQSIGQALLELVADVKARVGGRHLCLGGGLFYNSYFNTIVAQSACYERTFVPVNPGNAGVAVGAALEVAGPAREARHGASLSAFLGPAYDAAAVKATLDNCKLSYDFVYGGTLIDRTVKALAQGKLVGWFQDRMEWGPRALGNRSILASPLVPFALENLNIFLKHREPHRSYSVSVCEEDLSRYFRGPTESRFMEYQYQVLDPGVFRPLLPLEATTLRVQTVPESAGLFHSLIKAFGELTGVPVLVNTSFNGFNEPIVCTPRDAVRVFYGTGLDTAIIGDFVLQK